MAILNTPPLPRTASQETTHRITKSTDNLLRYTQSSEIKVRSEVSVMQQMVNDLKRENESLIRKN